MDIEKKIRKLLALSESPNEFEAQAALLKARQLMAEYKLTEAELHEGNKKVKTIKTSISCTKQTNLDGKCFGEQKRLQPARHASTI